MGTMRASLSLATAPVSQAHPLRGASPSSPSSLFFLREDQKEGLLVQEVEKLFKESASMGAGGSVQTGLSEGVRRHCASEFERLCPRDRDFLLLAGAARGHVCARGGSNVRAPVSVCCLPRACERSSWRTCDLNPVGSCSVCRNSAAAVSAGLAGRHGPPQHHFRAGSRPQWPRHVAGAQPATRQHLARTRMPYHFAPWNMDPDDCLRVRGRNCWTLLPFALSRPTNSATANFR